MIHVEKLYTILGIFGPNLGSKCGPKSAEKCQQDVIIVNVCSGFLERNQANDQHNSIVWNMWNIFSRKGVVRLKGIT